jgi:dCMP deaminase
MLGATLYMACVDPENEGLVPHTTSCMMCKKQVINACIAFVVVRDDKENYRVIDVNDWINDDDSLTGMFGY